MSISFKKWSNVKVKRLCSNTKILSQALFIWNIKSLALTIQILFTGQSIQNVGQTPRSRSQGRKCLLPRKGSDTKKVGHIPRSRSQLLVPK